MTDSLLLVSTRRFKAKTIKTSKTFKSVTIEEAEKKLIRLNIRCKITLSVVKSETIVMVLFGRCSIVKSVIQ